jgi:RNA polymerase sigma factor FliA
VALGENRNIVLAKYGPYVRSLASTVRRQFHATLDLDELISWGQVGLLEAAERFDAKVGANFLTFAHYRIKGSIFDGLKKMGVLRGSDARAAFAGERANAYLGSLSGRESESRSPTRSITDDVREISSAATGLAMVFATSFEATEGLQIADEAMPADERLEIEQLKFRVRAAIANLPEKERQLLKGYYFEGKTLEEAGGQVGQSKSWASRLHARAIERLRDMLGEQDERSTQSTSRRSVHGGASGSRGDHPGLANRSANAGAKPKAPAQGGPVEV